MIEAELTTEAQAAPSPSEESPEPTYGIFEGTDEGTGAPAAQEAPAAPAPPAPAPAQESAPAQENVKATKAAEFAEATRAKRQLLETQRQLQELQSSVNEMRQAAKSDPRKFLEALGLTDMNSLTDAVMGIKREKEEDPVAKTSKQLEEIRAEMQRQKQAYESEKASRFEYEAKVGIQQTIHRLGDGASVLASELQSNPKIYDELYGVWLAESREAGRYVDMADLVTRAEKYYTDQLFASIERANMVKKIKEGQRAPSAPQTAAPVAPAPAAQPKTLTRDLGATPPAPRHSPINDEEADREFLEIMKKEGWKAE